MNITDQGKQCSGENEYLPPTNLTPIRLQASAIIWVEFSLVLAWLGGFFSKYCSFLPS